MRNGYDPMEDSEDQPLDLRRVLEVLRRRWLSILSATTLLLVPGLIFVFSRPAVYEATVTVSIQRTPKVMELGPDYMPTESDRQWSQSITALVGSDTVLGRVVDRLPRPPDPDLEQQRGLLSRIGLRQTERRLTPQQERQARVAAIREALTLELEGGGTVLAVSATTRDAGSAAALANAVAEAYVGYLQDERQAASRRATAWLSQKILELRAGLERQEEAIAELVLRTGIVPSELEGRGEGSKSGLVEELRLARIELLTAQQRLAELGLGASVRRAVGASTEQDDLLREQFAEARAALDVARLQYTPNHPELIRLERLVASLEERLGPGPEKIREYRELKAEESRLEARATVLERALDELSVQTGANAEAKAAYERRERELSIDRRMLEVLLQRRNETMLAAATGHPDAQILDAAIVPIAPIGPKRLKWGVFGLGLAISFGFGVGLVREMLDQRLRDLDRVVDLLGVPFLGVIPRIRNGTAPELQTRETYGSPASESFRNLRTALLFSTRGSGAAPSLGRLVVTSAQAGEGKTTVAVRVAQSFAQLGWKVLLVDGDLRRSRVHRVLELKRAPGLAELLREEVSLEEAVQKQGNLGLDVITSGKSPENPSELLTSVRLDRIGSEIKKRYDLIVVDCPVLLSVPDALLLAARADATLLVHKPGTLEKSGFVRLREELQRAGAHVVGLVLTQVAPTDRYLYPSYLESPYVEAHRRWWTRMRADRRSPRAGGSG